MNFNTIKLYEKMNMYHTNIAKQGSDKGVFLVLLFMASAIQSLSFAISLVSKNCHMECSSYCFTVLIAFLLNLRYQSKVVEKGKNSNFFEKLMYVPCDMKAVLVSKLLYTVKFATVYLGIVMLNGIYWRVLFNFWIQLLFEGKNIALTEVVYNFCDTNLFYSLEPLLWVAIVTLVCMGQIVYDYVKATREK